MSHNYELANLHSILENLNNVLENRSFSKIEFEEEIKESFKKYSFKYCLGLSRQAYNILLNYTETKEDAVYIVSELKRCLIPRTSLLESA